MTTAAPTTTQHLHRLYLEYHRDKYPNVPTVCIPKPDYSDKTTNGLTRMILDWFKFQGGIANRINTTGRQIKAKSGKQIWIPGTTMKGTSDIAVTYRGQSIAIEVKCSATRDRMRPKQKEYADRFQRAGGLYFVARSWDEFYEWFNTIAK